ncbi:hypothetical protein CEXT_714451 [Caerostris extrusa]|uniref:Uncharacterized protein n=1 Tax=Caerostris extrusa TaxID=172846 RepID=A0AAV4YGW3_CAEEX|nr:hypothetical protein CEXT_714451 [Caerostris extrusa]
MEKENQNESDASSGYGSDMDSPNNAVYNINENNEVLHAIKHDHDFYFSPIGRLPYDGNVLQQNDLKIGLVDMEEKSVVDCGINSDIFMTNHTYMECSYESAEVLAGHEKFVALNYFRMKILKNFQKSHQIDSFCKKLDYLGDTPILFCEYLDSGVFTVDTSGEQKIIFDEAMLKQIQNLNLKVKDYKTVNGHLLVILEPDTE